MEYDKTLTEVLKETILSKYQNVKKFSDASNIPYMTISNVLKRGVENSSLETVSKICDALEIPLYSLYLQRAASALAKKLIERKDTYTDSEFFDDLKANGFIRNFPKEDFFKNEDKAKNILNLYKESFLFPDQFEEHFSLLKQARKENLEHRTKS